MSPVESVPTLLAWFLVLLHDGDRSESMILVPQRSQQECEQQARHLDTEFRWTAFCVYGKGDQIEGRR